MHNPPLEIPRLRALVRHALPNLVEATVVPLLVFYSFLWLTGVWGGLIGALAWSYIAIVRRLGPGRPIPGLLVLGVIGMAARPGGCGASSPASPCCGHSCSSPTPPSASGCC